MGQYDGQVEVLKILLDDGADKEAKNDVGGEVEQRALVASDDDLWGN